MRRIYSILFCWASVLFYTGCARTYNTEVSRSNNFDMAALQSSSVVLIGSSFVSDNQYSDTYHKAYESNSDFVRDILSRLKESILTDSVAKTCKLKSSMDGYAFKHNFWSATDRPDSIISSIKAKYIIDITGISIDKESEEVTRSQGHNPDSTRSKVPQNTVTQRISQALH